MNYTLMTTVNDATMSADFGTEQAAQGAAVSWVEGQADTILLGDLHTRWAKARAWWCGQGGTMDVTRSYDSDPASCM